MESHFIIRSIMPNDNPPLAKIIRTVMSEFGACGPGFAIHDAEVDDMYSSYSQPRCAYWVVGRNAMVLGGGGIAPLTGGPADTCELRKMYFLPDLRHQGMGQKLIGECLKTAREFKFNQCYLETLASMEGARKLYEKIGFYRIEKPMGATGHFGCNNWYLKSLS